MVGPCFIMVHNINMAMPPPKLRTHNSRGDSLQESGIAVDSDPVQAPAAHRAGRKRRKSGCRIANSFCVLLFELVAKSHLLCGHALLELSTCKKVQTSLAGSPS